MLAAAGPTQSVADDGAQREGRGEPQQRDAHPPAVPEPRGRRIAEPAERRLESSLEHRMVPGEVLELGGVRHEVVQLELAGLVAREEVTVRSDRAVRRDRV